MENKNEILQNLFDKMASHLLKQNSQSLISFYNGEFCAYRGEGGKKCAVGILISDSQYEESLERNSSNELEVLRAILISQGLTSVSDELHLEISGMIRNIQLVHDMFQPKEWPKELKGKADQYGLRYDPNWERQSP